MFIHYFTSCKLFMVEMNNCMLELCNIVEKLVFDNLNYYEMYLSILPNGSFMLYFLDRLLLSHSKSLSFHLSHNLSSLLIIKLIKLISWLFPSSSLFLFSLFFLLHDNFITNNLFHDLSFVIKCTMLFRILPRSAFYIFKFNYFWILSMNL